MGFLGVLAALALQVAAQPSSPPPQQPATEVEGVDVRGRRPLTEAEQRKAESEFVRELSAPTRRERLARWDRALCVGVAGLPATEGGYIVDRIAQEALAVGLDVGQPGCRSNALILFTSDAERAARDLRAKHPTFFTGRPGRGGDTLESGGGGQRFGEFLRSQRPVRWWHVAKLTGSDGRPLGATEVPPGSGYFVPVNETTGSSRLASLWREDLSRAVVIVDAKSMRGVSYEALASYLAMVTLAQLDPEADPRGLESIMTLFADRDAGRTAPETLTAADRAYLKGLYASADDARNLNAQQGAIRRSLRQGATNAPPTP